MAEACAKNTPFRNRLIQLSSRGMLTTIEAARKAKMLATAQKHSQQLPLDAAGNISLSCVQDAKLLADLLDDAYLKSDQTGYLYNASRKKRTVIQVAVTTLPANLFFSTDVPACILVFKKYKGVFLHQRQRRNSTVIKPSHIPTSRHPINELHRPVRQSLGKPQVLRQKGSKAQPRIFVHGQA